MRLVIDVNPVINGAQTGVAYYVAGWLRTVLPLARAKGVGVVFFSSGWGKRAYPDWLTALTVKYQVERCHLSWPNKLLTATLILFHWPKLDQLVAKQCRGEEIKWWVLTNYAHSSVVKAKTTLVVHDLGLEFYPELFPRRWRLAYGLMRRRRPLVSRFMAVSHSTKQQIVEQWHVDPSLVTVCLPVLQPVVSTAKKITTDQPYWLSIGTIEPRKNLTLLLRALEMYWQRHPQDNHCWLIAGGWGWKSQGFKRALARSPYRTRVKLLGYLTEAARADVYLKADILLQGSLYEGIGLPPLEAQSYGVPVISSDAASLAEMLETSALLASRTETEGWVKALEKLSSPVVRQALTAAGLANVQRFYAADWATEVDWLFK